MEIQNIYIETKKEKLSGCSNDRLIACKLIVEVRDGDRVIEVRLPQDMNRLENAAFAMANIESELVK